MADPRPLRSSIPISAAERIRQVVARMTGRTPISDRMDLLTDLGLDTADRTELVVAIELACRVDLPPSEALDARSVGDLVALVEMGQAAADEVLREAIEDLVAGAAASAQPLDLGAAAQVLADEHRSASLDVPAIEAAIVRGIAAYASREDGKRKA